ncbi:MAG: hypothetical protein ACWGPN_08565, partial [Gammaproteobacteria bacterium]
SLLFLRNEKGFYSLWRYSLQSGTATRIEHLDEYTSMGQIATAHHSDSVALIASSSKIPSRILSYNPQNMPIPAQLSADSDAPGT